MSIGLLALATRASAQETPLLSGGAGFFTDTTSGQTSYTPMIQPLVAAPIGSHLLVESRAILLESFTPRGAAQPGYGHSHFISLIYLQGDYFLTPHITVVGGSFLIPFNTYNDRLSPIWIGNFQQGPLIAGIGSLGTGTGTGGMLSGSAISRANYSVTYNAYFSSRVGNQYFQAERGAGGRVSIFLPDYGLEAGLSYVRLLQGTHENFYGSHLWWEPPNSGFQLRSEFSRGHHAQGYWVEASYRTSSLGGLNSLAGRMQPLFRMNQTFRRDTIVSDSVPFVNTQQADFGLDYNLPRNTRILTSYSRHFSASGNSNIWQTGIVYRFLFPAWKARQ